MPASELSALDRVAERSARWLSDRYTRRSFLGRVGGKLHAAVPPAKPRRTAAPEPTDEAVIDLTDPPLTPLPAGGAPTTAEAEPNSAEAAAATAAPVVAGAETGEPSQSEAAPTSAEAPPATALQESTTAEAAVAPEPAPAAAAAPSTGGTAPTTGEAAEEFEPVPTAAAEDATADAPSTAGSAPTTAEAAAEAPAPVPAEAVSPATADAPSAEAHAPATADAAEAPEPVPAVAAAPATADASVATSVAVSRRRFPDGGAVECVVLARADALTLAIAAPVAAVLDAPLLAVPADVDGPPGEVADEVRRLGATRLVTMGLPEGFGTEAIGPADDIAGLALAAAGFVRAHANTVRAFAIGPDDAALAGPVAAAAALRRFPVMVGAEASRRGATEGDRRAAVTYLVGPQAIAAASSVPGGFPLPAPSATAGAARLAQLLKADGVFDGSVVGVSAPDADPAVTAALAGCGGPVLFELPDPPPDTVFTAQAPA